MPEAQPRTFETLAVGDSASFSVELSPEMVNGFAKLSGDFNPLHSDDAYAADTNFGARIPHGMIAGMLFSRLVGMELPGKHCLYLTQTLGFKKPLPLRGTVIVRGEIIELSESVRTAKLYTTVRDGATDELLVDGHALTHILKP
ncbi:MAG TPA: MaoC family dehydratase [Candidatus Paceibacterota bacterium]|nr:MaoC family dehydratase [Candidatus Paceibacterota bacterium]